jgi:hypothetical protein
MLCVELIEQMRSHDGALKQLRDDFCEKPHQGNGMPPCRSRATAVRTALLTVTIREKDILRVRRALTVSGMDFIKATRMQKDGRMRLQVGLAADRVGEAMSRIMACVDQAEFGKVTAGR